MEREALEFRIGLFVTSGVVLLVAMVIAFGELHLFRRDYEVVGLFNGSVGNVTKGAPVRLAGVDVGKASAIRLDKRGNVRACLRIYEPVTIKTDSQLAIKQDGILGEHYFEFTSGSDSAPELPKTGKVEIQGVVQSSMGDVAPQVSELLTRYEPRVAALLEELNKTITGLNAIIADPATQKNVRDAVRSTSETIAKGPALADKLNGSIAEATASFKDARGLLVRLNGTVDSVNGMMAEGKTQMAEIGKHYTALATDLRSLSVKMEIILNSMQRLVGEAQSKSTVGKLMTDDKLYEKLVETLDEARTTLSQVKQTFRYLEENPTALYWGDKNKGKVPEQKPPFWKRIFSSTPTPAKETPAEAKPDEPQKAAPEGAKPETVPPKPNEKK